LYWLTGGEPAEATAVPHPYVVVQDDVFNHSRLRTVVVCALTSNLQRAALLGNVLLEAGEGNLPRQSVVEVAKTSAVDKAQLGTYIGALSPQRLAQIMDGLRFLQTAYQRDV
jgi:mRNA interferase MazF